MRESRVKAPSSRELFCVDLRGMKAALVDQARARALSPSEVLRAALADSLKPGRDCVTAPPDGALSGSAARTRLSLRMSSQARLDCLTAARAARLTPGAFVAGLVAGLPVLASGQSRGDHLAALVASNAAMSTLARQVGQLVIVFGQGSTAAAREYRDMLDGITETAHGHIRDVSAVLADLRPRRAITPPSTAGEHV